MNFEESIAWLYSTQMFGIKLGLENTRRLLRESDLDPLRQGMEVIHVAGTNGKGSVCAFAEQILRDAGIQTGLFTSPHLITYRERIRVNGEMIDETSVARHLDEIRAQVSEWETHPTFFEISLTLAMRYFSERECEIVLLETGMGGRLDATNAVPADVSVITSIGLDHQQWLGETIREIAEEKAGILKPTVPVVVADQHPDARDVIGRKALTLGIPYIEAHPLPSEWQLGLAGPHQRENAALAVEAACRLAGDRLTQEKIQASLAATRWPGRFQHVSDRVTVDGAHNESAARALCRAWQESFPDEKARLVFGAAESKSVVEIFRELLPIIGEVILVPIQSERRLSAERMREALVEAGGESIVTTEVDSLSEALEHAQESEANTLVAGSLFLVGEALSLFEARAFEVSLQ